MNMNFLRALSSLAVLYAVCEAQTVVEVSIDAVPYQFNSPNYPSDYGINENIAWIFRAPPGYLLNIRFLDFATESGFDYVWAGVGPVVDSTAVGGIKGFFDGSVTPNEFTVPFSTIWVHFQSDGSVVDRGFSAEVYRSKTYSLVPITTLPYPFTSPSYPSNYGVLQGIVWAFMAPPGYRLTLRFLDFYLESGYDFLYVAFTPGWVDPASRVATLDGDDLPDDVTVPGNTMWVIFDSDSSITERGFSAVVLRTPDVIPQDMLVSHPPQLDRHASLYVYAIETDLGEVELSTPEGLPSELVTTGIISKDDDDFGCYMHVGVPNQLKRHLRYGSYGAKLADGDTRRTYVKLPSSILDTNGVYTVTVYPKQRGASAIDQPTSIGVRRSPRCPKYTWRKGRTTLANDRPRLAITCVEQAGLYTVHRRLGGRSSGRVQIQVIAATCPRGFFSFGPDIDQCAEAAGPCKNGGVLKDDDDSCICHPIFDGVRCGCVRPASARDGFVLATGDGSVLRCADLPGGNPRCKGHLICFGDNYGCKCSSGWRGNGCDKPCPKGTYGPGCTEDCPDNESACDRFFGPLSNRDLC